MENIPDKIEIIENFVDDYFFEEVKKLVPGKEKTSVSRNQILRWGSDKPYPDNIISSEIPEIFNQFKDSFEFNSVTINEYYPNQYIDWHIDKPDNSEPIIILSLLNDADIHFRKNKKILSFKLPKNSLTIISYNLRSEWEHSLKAVKKRYSIVFRR